MHIPDGYLSPETCLIFWGGSAPFWYVALRRLKGTLHTRVTPLLSLFSAFAFIVMMFNVPLPGGTTGHAVGVTIATVVLGLWGSIVSISIALTIQAVLFGDGGITTLGANCFNMAILGSLAACLVYRIISGKSSIQSGRRVIAAGIAGYVSINLSALAAATELGIQPRLFHDASGTPLYAPYPLHIAIPAMMIGHLTIAGAAEFALSAGMVGYLRLADPSLLRMSAPVISASAKGRRALWAALAALLVLTPLGVRVAGSAWAEWAPADFTRPEMRSQITSASLHEPPPSAAPAGLRKLAGVWAAPVQGYAPAFLKGAAGYGWSAAVGTMFIFLTSGVLVWVVRRRPVVVLPQSPSRGPDFIGKTLGRLAGAMARASFAESLADHRGPLQRLDPRGKLVGFAFMLIAVVASHRVEPIVGIFLVAVALALGSGIRMGELARRVWIPVILFTGAIAVPAMFVAAYGGPRGAVFLLLRAGGAATLSTVLLMTTRWPDVLKAMRALRVPALIVAVLGMTCRYILSILRIALEMFESLKSRTVGPLTTPQRRKIVVATAGVLLEKSLQTSGEVHQAMLSRGFRGEVRIAREFTFVRADWCWLGAFAVLSGAALWAGR